MKHSRIVLMLSTLLLAFAGSVYSAEGEVARRTFNRTLTIEVSEKPLDIVLQWISRRSGVNVVCNELEQPKVTMRLVDVSWQEAVDQIARKYDMVLERRSDSVWELTRPPKVHMNFQNAQLERYFGSFGSSG